MIPTIRYARMSRQGRAFADTLKFGSAVTPINFLRYAASNARSVVREIALRTIGSILQKPGVEFVVYGKTSAQEYLAATEQNSAHCQDDFQESFKPRGQALVLPEAHFYGSLPGFFNSADSRWYIEPYVPRIVRTRLNAEIPVRFSPENSILHGAGVLQTDFGVLNHWDPTNWYHFLVDLVPKLWAEQELYGRSKVWLVPNSVQLLENHRWVLSKILKPENIRSLPETKTRSFRLISMALSPSLSFWSTTQESHRAERLYFQADKVRGFSTWLSQKFGLDQYSSGNALPSKIFLGRNLSPKSRRIHNQDDVVTKLQPCGFVERWLESYKPDVQAAAIRAATVVVAPAGAALTNMLFARPGTRFVVYGSPGKRMWQDFGTALDLDVRLVDVNMPELGAQGPRFKVNAANVEQIKDEALG